MTREEALCRVKGYLTDIIPTEDYSEVEEIIKALKQQPCRDMEEIREVMSCDADAETKCKMISYILTAKPHYFEKQTVQDKQAESEKIVDVLDKIRAEIDGIEITGQIDEHTSFIRTGDSVKKIVLEILDKYR